MGEVWRKVDEYFRRLRFDPSHHLGLGDIRLTIAQQEEVVKIVQLSAGIEGGEDDDDGRHHHTS